MSNATNYPSCIKIPSTNVKQSTTVTMFSRNFDIKEALTLNNELISLANQKFGEGKWNHTVTNQSIDFVESFMGKYICGCVTFIKIQLNDGTFHEDMGYCYAEGDIKGSSIYSARIGSVTDAFKKVLSCFGNDLAPEIEKLFKKITNFCNIQKEDLKSRISPEERIETFKPCAQSTPLISNKNGEHKENNCKPKIENDQEKQSVTRSKSPVEQKGQTMIQTFSRLKSSTEQKAQSIPVKITNSIKGQFQSNDTNYQKEQEQKKQDQTAVISEEELLRLERKRRQIEKQAEYKRLMKEKEQQKFNENRTLNPKY
nr:DNA repair protein RAD52 homolog isoform X1 [Osmia lignaria]